MQVTSHKDKGDQKKKGDRRIVGKDALSEGIADGKETFLRSQISVLGLDSRAEKGLLREGIETVEDLALRYEDEARAIEGFGQKAMFTVKWAFAQKGVSFFTGDIKDFPRPQEGETDRRLAMTVERLELSIRTAVILRKANIRTIGELTARSSVELLRLKLAGRRTLRELKGVLADLGLDLRDSPEEQKSPDHEGIHTLDIDKTTVGILNSVGVRTIGDLTAMDEYGLLRIKKIGRHRAKRIKEALERKGLRLKPIPSKKAAAKVSAAPSEKEGIVDSAEDGQEHFISIGALNADTPASTRKAVEKAPWDEWKEGTYERMGNDVLLDTARMIMESEAVGDVESFRASAPELYSALERRQLCGELFETQNLGGNNDSAGEDARAETKSTSKLEQLSALAGEARKEVEKLLETVKPENLQATLKLLAKL